MRWNHQNPSLVQTNFCQNSWNFLIVCLLMVEIFTWRHFGRKTTNKMVKSPSPYFSASVSNSQHILIQPLTSQTAHERRKFAFQKISRFENFVRTVQTAPTSVSSENLFYQIPKWCNKRKSLFPILRTSAVQSQYSQLCVPEVVGSNLGWGRLF